MIFIMHFLFLFFISSVTFLNAYVLKILPLVQFLNLKKSVLFLTRRNCQHLLKTIFIIVQNVFKALQQLRQIILFNFFFPFFKLCTRFLFKLFWLRLYSHLIVNHILLNGKNILKSNFS